MRKPARSDGTDRMQKQDDIEYYNCPFVRQVQSSWKSSGEWMGSTHTERRSNNEEIKEGGSLSGKWG